MTDINAALANDTPRQKMAREQMQGEALVIENLLGAVLALAATGDKEDAFTLSDMAHSRVAALGRALDSQNCPDFTTKGGAA